jgi:3-isopropylmalate dehydrogenase
MIKTEESSSQPLGQSGVAKLSVDKSGGDSRGRHIKTWNIAVLPGDGIGPEVMVEGLKVLAAIQALLTGVKFQLTKFSVGAAEYLRNGSPLPEKTFTACQKADAILLAAMGLPEVRWPDGKEMTPQIDLRERLDLYNGLRPIRLYHELHTPLKNLRAGDIDLVIVRESTEGLFSSRSSKINGDTEASDLMRVTRRGAERICRAAFRIAQQRRKRIAMVDKANVLPSMAFFRSVFDAVALEFPGVQVEHVYVDAAALFLVQKPQRFDVIVTENMFGDILSDLAAGLIGGMGMAPSADLGEKHAVFQPSHGSAPDIAGKGIANPVAMILSVALMLEWFDHPETHRGAGLIRRAVEAVLARPENRTCDLGGEISTAKMGDLIVAHLQP